MAMAMAMAMAMLASKDDTPDDTSRIGAMKEMVAAWRGLVGKKKDARSIGILSDVRAPFPLDLLVSSAHNQLRSVLETFLASG